MVGVEFWALAVEIGMLLLCRATPSSFLCSLLVLQFEMQLQGNVRSIFSLTEGTLHKMNIYLEVLGDLFIAPSMFLVFVSNASFEVFNFSL